MVSTVAGNGMPASPAFGPASGVVSDGANLYVTDVLRMVIRKIVIATGAASVLAGQDGVAGGADGIGTAATFNMPGGIVIDSTNSNLYVADALNNKIRKIVIATGAVSTLAGTGAWGAADGAGAAATFNFPSDLATDGANLYVADIYNNKIRKVVIATGVVSTLAGTGAPGAADGAGLSASFWCPQGITTDGANLYVSDIFNNKIRKIVIATGVVSSLTGPANTAVLPGATDGAAALAAFNRPTGITTDGTSLFVADTNNDKIRQIVIATGQVGSFTGSANTAVPLPYWKAFPYVDGPAASATFYAPGGVALVNGSLYVTDGSGPLRQIASGVVHTAPVNPADGAGGAAMFTSPGGVVSDGANLYVADTGSNSIRKIVIATGVVTTLAGKPTCCFSQAWAGAADGTGADATFNLPYGITTDGTSLYVVDTGNNKIRKITPASGTLGAMTAATAVVTSFTGVAGVAVAAGAADGPAASAAFSSPHGIATDGVYLYVADRGNNKIRKIAIATGAVSSLTGASSVSVTAGAADGAGLSASFSAPAEVASDGANLYVADTGNNKIRKIAIASGTVSSLTGASGVPVTAGAADGAAASASFALPDGITTDGTNLYVADTNNNKVRQVVIATGVVSSLTGVANTAGTAGYADGLPTAATFRLPEAIIAVGSGVYVTDRGNDAVRKIQ